MDGGALLLLLSFEYMRGLTCLPTQLLCSPHKKKQQAVDVTSGRIELRQSDLINALFPYGTENHARKRFIPPLEAFIAKPSRGVRSANAPTTPPGRLPFSSRQGPSNSQEVHPDCELAASPVIDKVYCAVELSSPERPDGAHAASAF